MMKLAEGCIGLGFIFPDTKQGFVSSETKVITTLGRLAAAAQEE
jgi:hypothetical protein